MADTTTATLVGRASRAVSRVRTQLQLIERLAEQAKGPECSEETFTELAAEVEALEAYLDPY